ncbi:MULTISPECIES: hypothetical protein [unclassified Sporosarcina]|uniref:hypothetical protein n=1 Tax=unclassified Sporosarcina TaxID=2647733 RepID=UPI002042036B|nr:MULTISPECIES: hypothetical protein [unclassified Sporosarcina]GKV64210.1 hypothetical protein NCCP2331_03630 [Sporosarcina sp. NCCP-2331]GLB54325.1 hypothetical protein NCCP2378_01100 [Sporosarcina sp. NCCP-2378]
MNLNSLSISSAKITAPESQPLALKEGQMIHGKVQQLFPGQMAQVQVGSHQLFAKLEVPMQAGDTYYFKVNGTEPEVKLQVIAGPMRGAEGQTGQLTQLMDSLNLPKTQEMKELLAAIIKQKIPMTKENILDAANLLKSVPESMKAEALAALGKIAEARLPFTPAVFQSLLQAQNGTITQNLTALQTAVQNETSLPPAVREALLNALQAVSNPASQAVGKELLSRALTLLLDPQTGKGDRFAALQLLKSAEILPARTSLANLPQVLAQLVSQTGDGKTAAQPQITAALQQNALQQSAGSPLEADRPVSAMNAQTQAAASAASQGASNQVPAESQATAVKTLQTMLGQLAQMPAGEQQNAKSIMQNISQQIQNSPALPEQMKTALQTVVSQFAQQPLTDSVKAAFIEQFSQTLLQQTSSGATVQTANATAQPVAVKEAQQALLSLVSLPPQQADEALRALVQSAEKSGNVQIKQMVQAAEIQLSQTMSGPVMKEAMQSVLSSLGFNYEALLNGKEPAANLANTLKPQLLTLLQDPSLSLPLREAAETMVLRMNGTVIQTADTSVQQQIIMQVPLDLFGKKIEATLQWNGRMKENGQIDPAFARILFYLELETLSTTLVDMHVQNKVVNLTIFNEEESLRTTGLSFQALLKDGLENVGYKLSGVSFKPFTESQQTVKKPAAASYIDERGVDYRI